MVLEIQMNIIFSLMKIKKKNSYFLVMKIQLVKEDGFVLNQQGNLIWILNI